MPPALANQVEYRSHTGDCLPLACEFHEKFIIPPVPTFEEHEQPPYDETREYQAGNLEFLDYLHPSVLRARLGVIRRNVSGQRCRNGVLNHGVNLHDVCGFEHVDHPSESEVFTHG